MKVRVITAIFAFFCLILSACQTLPNVQHLPEQAVDVRLFKLEQLTPLTQQSLLTVQFEPSRWRWIQTDPLGSPLARVILTPNGWQNDGFVMPNQQAKLLFSAVANVLNPNEQPFQLDSRWRLEINSPEFFITLPDGSQWKIRELQE